MQNIHSRRSVRNAIRYKVSLLKQKPDTDHTYTTLDTGGGTAYVLAVLLSLYLSAHIAWAIWVGRF